MAKQKDTARQCKRCEEVKPIEAFRLVGDKANNVRWVCRACHNKRMTDWYKQNREHVLSKARARYQADPSQKWTPERRKRANELAVIRGAELRDEVIGHYGRQCVACGEDEPMFLTLDHIDNDGGKWRKVHATGTAMYRWVRKNGYPSFLQTLCMNCNWGKARNGGVLVKDRRVLSEGPTTSP